MEAKIAKLNLSPTINDLSNEILLKIFAYLPQSDHYAVGLVSKRFQNLIDRTKWVETSVLEITENNVRDVKKAIERKNTKLCFKRVRVFFVRNIEDLEYILKSIGKEIEYIWMSCTAGFHLLKDKVVNLKSLVIYFDNVLENCVNDGSFDLNFFPHLEELSFISNSGFLMNSTTIKLLEQLKSPGNTTILKHLKLGCNKGIDNFVIDNLLHFSSTLESLELYYVYNDMNIKNWHTAFSLMKNLKKLCLTGFQSEELMNIFSAFPKETPLEHLQLRALGYIDYNKILRLIIEKLKNSLKFLELNFISNLTDDIAMELGKLSELRLLKLINCRKITNMGFLAGIANEQNMFIDELYLENIPNLDELGLRVIVSRFPNLRVLTLLDLEKAITNNSLQNIWRFSTRLRSLKIDCRNITDEGMIGFGNNNAYSINRLRILVKLTLENCESLTDRTLIEALKLPALRSLELGNCPKITLQGIESLMMACPLLEFLSIPSTIIINDDVINDDVLFVIGNGLKHLRKLNITYCVSISKEDRDHIKDVFGALQDSATFSPDCVLN